MEGDGLPLSATVILPKTRKNIKIDRVLTLCRGVCLLLLLKYRFNNPLQDAFIIWAIAGFCECLFVLNFIIYSLLKWRPVERQTDPHTLSARYEKRGEPCKLYPVDIFITTADPQKEPPLITANTILSVLAVGYPADRVSCYVSDDSASPVIFCMMLEVFTFAQKWVPFCKSHSIEPRSPAKLFSSRTASSLFEQGNELKEEYEQLENRINDLAQRPQEALKIARRYTSWASDNPYDHQPIVEVVNNIGIDRFEWNAPLLVYVAREKREGYKHQFKAGALNALMRVSGILSNSPFILNLDCDTYINDSNALRHAMCVFMDTKLGYNAGFVQFPQVFDNLDRQDVHGNRLVFLYDVLLKGLDGIQGPYYCGTGCFLRRTALHGVGTQEGSLLEDCRLELGKSALTKHDQGEIAWVSKEAALDLCSCNHEKGTAWGKQVGWSYGSSTEDVLTGYGIHCLGWRSIYLWLTPPAFKGMAPSTAPDRLAQRKRIAAGLVSMLLMQSSSFFYNPKTRLMFLERIAYIYNCMFYAGISVFAMLYMVLHVACLFSSKSLTPKAREYETIWFIGALCFQHGMSFLEYKWGAKNERFGVREWWNEERFWGGVEALEYMGGELLFGMWSLFILYPIVCQMIRVLKGYTALTSFVMLVSFIVTILLYVRA
ncbi:hypothetical protein SUGI_0058140 [Cryptomeria japonica]|nr:hypothetical protein SUGI_0058140 [Cryptomeria japonica]